MADDNAEATEGTTGNQQPVAATSPWNTLPEDLRNNEYLARHKDVESLVREHINAQSLIGRKGVIPPSDWNDKQQVTRFYRELGVPEKPSEYDLSRVQIPENVPWDDQLGLTMLRDMHEAGLTPRQAETVIQKYADYQANLYSEWAQGLQASRENVKAELQQQWGRAYEEKLRRASDIAKHAWGDDLDAIRTLQLQDGSMLGDNPLFLKGLAQIGEVTREHQAVGDKQPRRLTKTPQEARDEWTTLQTDADFNNALWDKNHPAHSAAVSRRDALYAAMHPEETEQ